MKLYYAPNTISVVVAITLEEIGADYEAVRIDFASAEQTKAPYLEINPKGRVPALSTDKGLLTETGAILEYVAPHLVPTDAYQAARMREAMYYLASTMHVNHAHRLRGTRWANNDDSIADMKAKVPETMAQSCTYLENNFPLDPFVLGATLSLADPYLTVVASWLDGDKVDVSAYPKLAHFIATMDARPSVKKVREMGMLG